jgi:hypothetical protein
MKKIDKKLKPAFVITSIQKTATWFFNQHNRWSMSEKESTGKTFEEVYNLEMTAEMENAKLLSENGHNFGNSDRRFMYCIREYEVLTDNRSIFGHQNQVTERMVSESGNVFVTGQLTTLKDFSTNRHFKELSLVGLDNFYNFLSHELDIEYRSVTKVLKDEREDIKFIYFIQGEYGEHNLYWKFVEGDVMKPFQF